MKKIIPLILSLLVIIASCSFVDYSASDELVITGKAALKLAGQDYMMVDAQKATSYAKEHVAGASNIERAAINVAEPVPNTVAPAAQVAQAAGAAGLTADSDIVVYDDNNGMDAARLFWTLKYYGHKGDIKIVSGGFSELADAGAEIVKGSESIAPKTYSTSSPDKSMIATLSDISKNIDNDDFVLIDVRSDEEYYGGTIPGSIHINYEENNFLDGAIRPSQHIRILYKGLDIMPDDEIVMYCKTSIRAANTYAALYNAGYRNLKIYDGAWLEWSASGKSIYTPERNLPTVQASADNS